jgi:hypothetical protein
MRMIQTNYRIQIILIVRYLPERRCLELGSPLNSRENILHNISQLYTIVSEEMILEEVSSGER